MELSASDLWRLIVQRAQPELPAQVFKTWLVPTKAVALSDRELLVETPSSFHADWLSDKYGRVIEAAARSVLGHPLSVTFIAGEEEPERSVPAVTLSAAPPPATARPSPAGDLRIPAPASLNRRYTFERFVVGGDNQLAAAAAIAVAENPGRAYNPLFLYGGVGLGKTHLMHAVGNRVLATHPGTRVAYVPTEQFVNELVTAIQEGTTGEFRRRYRQIDLLLVDDVHFLERKERTQEEFFHTFNALYDSQKQIVLTSDRPPKEIPTLEERLISRFEWGLVADIKAPDYETRVAILRKKASDDGLTLDPDVIDFIAQSCTSSVRELEGAVIKLLAYSSLKKVEITLPVAETALGSMLRKKGEETLPVPLSINSIKEAVAKVWGVDRRGIESKRRTKALAEPRQAAMYLIRDLLGLSLVEIGDAFGGRDHSTVIHSIRKMQEELPKNPQLNDRILRVRKLLETYPGQSSS